MFTAQNFTNIPSPLEETDNTFWDWLARFLPNWMKEDIASRLPTPTEVDMGQFNILFMQTNICVYFMVVSFICIIIFVLLVCVLQYLKNNREYFMSKVSSTFLTKLMPSENTLSVLILVNKVSVLISFIALSLPLRFLYMNPIPGHIGKICDAAITAITSLSPFFFTILFECGSLVSVNL